MNYISIAKFGIIAVILLGFMSCETNFEEINSNPNGPVEVPTSYLLTAAQKSMMDNTWDEWFNGRRGNQLAQYWSSNQYSSESRYQFRQSISNGYWRNFYAGSLNDLQRIIDLNTEDATGYEASGSSGNQIAVAKILQSWLYQNITDCWGSIPYTEALKGADARSPIYDTQEDVYRALLVTLKDVNDNLIDDTGAGVVGDAIYGGDMGKWKKFANSLRLRVAMRMADKDAATAETHIKEAIAGGVFASNDDNAVFPYLASVPNNNPLNEDRKTRSDFAASDIMVDELLALNDPRIDFFYEPAVNGGAYVGEVYGLTEANATATTDDDVSQPSSEVLAADAPGIFMDYAQVRFIQSEAAARGMTITGSAADHYRAGVEASMDFWNDGTYTAADVTAYLAQADVDYATLIGAGDTWKQVIGKQKWIALYMQGIQGWTEWRRLDFGILKVPADGVLAGTGIPTRMEYPLDEQTLNKTNYGAAVSAQGADQLDTKLWWDAN